MNFSKTISSLLTGTPQSQYAAIAILIAMIAIILSVLFNENELTLSERFMLIGSVILFSIPAIILGLFDLTCVSGKTVENSLCWWWGWVIAFMIIIICVIVVFASISSMLTYNVATVKTTKPVIDEEESNKIAKDMVKEMPETKPPVKEVTMPPTSDMTMQPMQNTPDMSGMSGMSGMEMNNMDMGMNNMGMNTMAGYEPFKNKKESFKKHLKSEHLKSEQFSNFNVEGFQGCEYEPV